jgi:hypothetical protein
MMLAGEMVPDRDSVLITIYPCGDTAMVGAPEFDDFLKAFKNAYGVQ